MFLDRYAYNNRLKDVNPLYKMAFAFSMMVLGFAGGFWVHLFIFAIMATAAVFIAGIDLKGYAGLLSGAMLFLLPGAFVVFLSSYSPREAALLCSRSLAMVSCFYFLCLTTPALEIVVALKGLGVPRLFVELAFLTYRQIFTLADYAGMIYSAQAARLGYISFESSLRSTGLLVSGLFTKAMEGSNKLQMALEARGYDGGELKVLDIRPNDNKKENTIFAMWASIIVVSAMILSAINSLVKWGKG
ncbi:cobalt/nickel transport system permease protein [Caldanaerovirga acetigignens]|uniref:Cobalt/nickel transport system permease protein n=1 Tax=Caldanaerovirga acetigignens TaxID=447595 RepID=A0A1M7IX26_9FIRM|nr:cobalt ECF transporter T component CbiQ [Caldanaerovirga acetigignens]SHM45239.1 cobalt/nickel transport system permease protein [Caldanaerovirga acetigignens]